MPNTVHGHDVMEMIIDAPTPPSREELCAAVVERFGGDALFYTCSAKDMSIEGLLEFLMERNKLVEVDGKLSTHPDHICDH